MASAQCVYLKEEMLELLPSFIYQGGTGLSERGEVTSPRSDSSGIMMAISPSPQRSKKRSFRKAPLAGRDLWNLSASPLEPPTGDSLEGRIERNMKLTLH